MILRRATLDDMELLIKLRLDYFAAENDILSAETLDTLQKSLRSYFKAHLPAETFIAIIGEIDGRAVSTAYLAIREVPANPSFMNGRAATIYNVLTYPEYRGRGLATRVLQKIIDEAERLKVPCISLSATAEGLPIYERLGFRPSRYTAMNLSLL